MPKLLRDLRERLLRAGFAPRHVRRYLRELSDHFTDVASEQMLAGHSRVDAESIALARLGNADHLAAAMIARPELRSWSARAPWAAFSIGPVLSLSAAYFVACFILWSGWRIFMPAASTPFGNTTGPIYGIENIYFQIGRMIYFGAPIVIAWAVAFVAIRQRLKPLWPILSSLILAFIGSTAQVHAVRPSLELPGHVSMSLAMVPDYALGVRILALFTLGFLPYLIFRLTNIFHASHEARSS